MKRGMVGLILVLALLAGSAFAAQMPVPAPDPFGDDVRVFVGGAKGAYLGVRTQDVTKERMGQLKLREETGVEITMVDRDAPAGKAGIKEHDVILTFNGARVEGEEQLRRMVRETPPGRAVNLGISRDGQIIPVQVTLANRKEMMKQFAKQHPMEFEMPDVPIPPVPPMEMEVPNVIVQSSSSRSGLSVETVTPQLAEFFGVRGGNGGVLIRSVEKGSAADNAGLKAGDIIIRADADQIADMGDWRRVLRTKSGNVGLTIIRDKREQSVSLRLPERKNREHSLVIDVPNFEFDGEQIRVELEKVRPQLDLIAKEMSSNREEIRKAMVESRKAVERSRKDIERSKEEIRKAMEDISFECDSEW